MTPRRRAEGAIPAREVDERSADANHCAASEHGTTDLSMPRGHLRPTAAVRFGCCAGFVLLAACAATPGSPSLHDVPARPRMGYTVEQRRAIANALLADREQALWEGEQLRFRTGKSALPPPPQPREPTPLPPLAQAPTAIRPPANLESAIVAERMGLETDDGSLNAFLRQLVRRQPATVQAQENASARTDVATAGTESGDPLATAAARADLPLALPRGEAERAQARPVNQPQPTAEQPNQPSALDRFLDYLGGALAVGRADPAGEPAPAASEESGSSRPAINAGAPSVGTESQTSARELERAGREKTALASTPARASAQSASREPPLVSILFPAGVATPPPEAMQTLRRALEDARLAQGAIEVIGQGKSPALALERARTVAQLLIEVGAPAERIRLRAAGPGDRVELRLSSR